jgi:hypothetical protein
MHTDIACVAAPRICPPGARAKVQTLFIDRPLDKSQVETDVSWADCLLLDMDNNVRLH